MFSGDTIGKYRLVRQLGRGGMGEVWLATASGHGGFKKNVVVKTLLPELACEPLFIDMLAHEARICAKLSHPNLIEVFDFVEHGGIYLLAMEHVDGQPLNNIMRAARQRDLEIPAWFALRVAWDCCRGLECAHDEGIVHCDLSPSNVMIAYTGMTKILDFGVAHSCSRGPRPDRLKGKFPYMSPERIKSRDTDRRTDIYALGVMLYLLFTGELPFTADTDAALLHKIVTERPRPPSELCEIDPRIEQIILRAMQADPTARHQSAAEVLAALSPCLDGLLGAYGQQEVAAFVKSMFESDDTLETRRATTEALPVIGGKPVPETSDVDELRSYDIEVDSSLVAAGSEDSILDIPRDVPRLAPPTVPMRIPVVDSSPRPVTAVFATSSVVHESRTTVQSLFGDGRRPSATSSGESTRIFDRPPPRNTNANGDELAAWPWPTSRSKS